jgi:hypothetical protein
MKHDNEAIVGHREFVKAVSAIPEKQRKRAKRRGSDIPKDTLLYAADDLLIVDAPAHRSTLGMKGKWSLCVSVNAQSLAAMCKNINESNTIRLVYAEDTLVLNDTLKISGKFVGRPEDQK